MSDRVLVTGGSGFVGKRLVEYLRLRGTNVIAPSRDILDITLNVFPEVDVNQVIHLAARTFVPDSWTDPSSFYQVNAQGTMNVADYCRRHGARLVHISAYCYGTPSTLPISETAPLRPNNAYAFSKYAGEAACLFYAEHFGIPVTILRPFNVYGPGQPSHFLIPRIVDQSLDPAIAQIVVEDAEPRRDYVHVDDLVAAISAVQDAPKSTGIYNVGSGRSFSVAEIADLIRQMAGVDKPVINRGNRRPNEILEIVCDATQIRRAFGWCPSIDLVDGLADLINKRRSNYQGRSSRLRSPSTC